METICAWAHANICITYFGEKLKSPLTNNKT